MAYKLTNKSWCPYADDYRCEFVMDSVDDVADLPTCCAGSTAIACEGGAVYMVNASGEWKEM